MTPTPIPARSISPIKAGRSAAAAKWSTSRLPTRRFSQRTTSYSGVSGVAPKNGCSQRGRSRMSTMPSVASCGPALAIYRAGRRIGRRPDRASAPGVQRRVDAVEVVIAEDRIFPAHRVMQRVGARIAPMPVEIVLAQGRAGAGELEQLVGRGERTPRWSAPWPRRRRSAPRPPIRRRAAATARSTARPALLQQRLGRRSAAGAGRRSPGSCRDPARHDPGRCRPRAATWCARSRPSRRSPRWAMPASTAAWMIWKIGAVGGRAVIALVGGHEIGLRHLDLVDQHRAAGRWCAGRSSTSRRSRSGPVRRARRSRTRRAACVIDGDDRHEMGEQRAGRVELAAGDQHVVAVIGEAWSSNSAARLLPNSEKALPNRRPRSTSANSSACCASSETVRMAATTPRWFCGIWPIDGSAAEMIAITRASVT